MKNTYMFTKINKAMYIDFCKKRIKEFEKEIENLKIYLLEITSKNKKHQTIEDILYWKREIENLKEEIKEIKKS